jgi:hypothetical protein
MGYNVETEAGLQALWRDVMGIIAPRQYEPRPVPIHEYTPSRYYRAGVTIKRGDGSDTGIEAYRGCIVCSRIDH